MALKFEFPMVLESSDSENCKLVSLKTSFLGLLLPICCIIYGSTSEKLIANFTFTGLDPNDPIVKEAIDQWEDDMIDKCVQFAIIGAFSWILGYIQVSMVTLGGQNLVHNLKKEAYKCFLR